MSYLIRRRILQEDFEITVDIPSYYFLLNNKTTVFKKDEVFFESALHPDHYYPQSLDVSKLENAADLHFGDAIKEFSFYLNAFNCIFTKVKFEETNKAYAWDNSPEHKYLHDSGVKAYLEVYRELTEGNMRLFKPASLYHKVR